MEDLEQCRLQVIEQITNAFPKLPRGKGTRKLKLSDKSLHDTYWGEELEEIFADKTWEEMISYPGIIYYLSEIDYLWAITDKAYLYYLPAFLVAVTLKPHDWIQVPSTSKAIERVLHKLTLEQVDAMIAFLEFMVRMEQKNLEHLLLDENNQGGLVPEYEDILLKLMLHRDEMNALKR